MKVLFIGGTGIISTEVTRLAVKKGMDVVLLNRGKHPRDIPDGVENILADIEDEADVCQKLAGRHFDAVIDFIAFKPEQVARDIRIFSGICDQYVLISSACVYRKPLTLFPITEGTQIENALWPYANDKILCESVLTEAYHQNKFPMTIARPTHTYSDVLLPVSLCGDCGSWSVAARMLAGKPVFVHGDGLSLWTVTHSRDVAKGIVGLLGNSHAIGEAVHITSDEVVSWDDIYYAIGKALGVTPKLLHVSTEMIAAFFPQHYGHMMGDTANCAIFDNTKIKRLVPDFAATTRMDQGVCSSVKYHLAHPELQKPDPQFDAVCDQMLKAYERFMRGGESPSERDASAL